MGLGNAEVIFSMKKVPRSLTSPPFSGLKSPIKKTLNFYTLNQQMGFHYTRNVLNPGFQYNLKKIY